MNKSINTDEEMIKHSNKKIAKYRLIIAEAECSIQKRVNESQRSLIQSLTASVQELSVRNQDIEACNPVNQSPYINVLLADIKNKDARIAELEAQLRKYADHSGISSVLVNDGQVGSKYSDMGLVEMGDGSVEISPGFSCTFPPYVQNAERKR